jgi:hypothetical protein
VEWISGNLKRDAVVVPTLKKPRVGQPHFFQLYFRRKGAPARPDPNPYTREATARHEGVHKQTVEAGIAKYGKDTPAFKQCSTIHKIGQRTKSKHTRRA